MSKRLHTHLQFLGSFLRGNQRIRSTSAAAFAGCFSLAGALLVSGCGSGFVSGTDGATSSAESRAVQGASLNQAPLIFPAGFMTSVKSYGAVGDGVTDDTAAIQRALADGRTSATTDYYGKPKSLYFPQGVYLVHDTLQWIGCCVTLQGAGATSSVIRLAPSSSGFTNAAQPKPMILTPLGNTSHRQNIWDLGFSVGSGNVGATALNYISNNVGSIHNVSIKSEDGQGHAGIDLTRLWIGPAMIRNIQVQGFDVGIDLKNSEYSTTFEKITLQKQNIAGIRNSNQPISIRGLSSTNAVPALTNSGGMVVLLDADLIGGTRTVPAIQTSGTTYLRNVSSSGYQATLQDLSSSAGTLTRGTIAELLVGAGKAPAAVTAAASLKLAVAETPSFTSSNVADWAPFTPRWYGDTAGLQPLMSSGKHTIYFPFAAYFAYNEAQVTVPDTVNRIVGFGSIVNGGAGTNGGGLRLIVSSNSTQPLIVEQFGYGIKIDHRGSRPVVIKDMHLNEYDSYPGSGQLFLEDVGMNLLTVQKGQQMWARQLNIEIGSTKVLNLGGSAWIMGLKTEHAGNVITTNAGGQTELLGSLIYPAMKVPATDVAFLSTDAKVSYIYKQSAYCAGCGYTIQVQETNGGQTSQVTASGNGQFLAPLFAGFN